MNIITVRYRFHVVYADADTECKRPLFVLLETRTDTKAEGESEVREGEWGPAACRKSEGLICCSKCPLFQIQDGFYSRKADDTSQFSLCLGCAGQSEFGRIMIFEVYDGGANARR